jgi:hypothetical protein
MYSIKLEAEFILYAPVIFIAKTRMCQGKVF